MMISRLASFTAAAILALASSCTSHRVGQSGAFADPPAATFSIVARDPATGELGVAVQSKIVAVGAVVPWAKAGVGAVATQSWANVKYGPGGIALLEKGVSPEEAIAALTKEDAQAAQRQVGIVAADGKSATFTGAECFPACGGVSGENFAAQGNLLAGDEVYNAMAEAFQKSEGSLADRLIAALEAGQEKGGDRRGKQSAALLIVRDGWGYGGGNDRFRDLRVDDHPEPIQELKRVLKLHEAMFPRPEK
ncbi:MAG: DUF1028 domain-containing protein [Verrucomicrobiales bacterium]